MAQHVLGGTASIHSNSTAHTLSWHAVVTERLIFGMLLLAGSVISFLALSWDIQWHTFVGRDRTLTPPHVMMLSGIALSGIAALVAVVVETTWMKRDHAMAQRSTTFAGLFAAPLGTYIAGYAALNAAVAFPLDQYWHTLYGIDVTIWAPFHIMVISGLALIAFGTTYLLASVANLATSIQAVKAKRVAHTGMIVAFAMSLALFMIMVASGIDPDTFLNLGFTSIGLYPLLAGLLLGGLLVGVAYAVRWKWAATSVVGVTLLFMVIDQLAVPPALNWLMQVEQLTFLAVHRSTPPQISVIAVTWPLLTLVTAIVIDVSVQRARTRGWSQRQVGIALAIAIAIGCIPFSLVKPMAALNTISSLNALGLLLTVAAGCLGIFVGIKLGQKVGASMATLEG